MRIYDNKDKVKHRSTCGYCRHSGHSVNRCPSLKAHYQANLHLTGKDVSWYYDTDTLVGVDNTHLPQGYQRYYSDLVCQRNFLTYFNRAEGYFAPKEKKPSKPRKPSKCGFCGSLEHNRKKCSFMNEFAQDLESANRNYRKMFYEQVLEPLQLGIGSFVMLAETNHSEEIYEHTKVSGMITSFNFDKIGIGNYYSRWSQYGTHFDIEINTTENEKIKLFNGLIAKYLSSKTFPDSPLYGTVSSNYYSHGIVEVIAPAPQMPEKEWFLGENPAFEWITKKKDMYTLYRELCGAIELFHPEGKGCVQKWYDRVYKK